MKKIIFLKTIILMLVCVTGTFAQEHFTLGGVDRVLQLKIKPGKGNEFWKDLRQNVKPLYEQYKKEGLIVDYQINLKSTLENMDDWGVQIVLQYKDFAALDDFAAKTYVIAGKFYGSPKVQQAAAGSRAEYADVVSSVLVRQADLKDMPK